MKKIIALVIAGAMCLSNAAIAQTNEVKGQVGEVYEKGSFSNSFTEVGHDNTSRAWREGMVGGNGETGFVTAGSPYSDTVIYQHMYFNYPSSQPREIPEELTEQLEEARENVFNLNSRWKIWNYDSTGKKVTRNRTYFYSYHPGAQLRIKSDYTDSYSGYERWTNYETAEVGVRYTDKYGEWIRTTFTSREDNVTITKIEKSSAGQLIDTTVSIDNIADMCKAWNGMSSVEELRYKKLVDSGGDYIALAAHYPAYEGSELYDGGYGSVTKIVAEGENSQKKIISMGSGDKMLMGENNGIHVTNAEAIYLITATNRSFDMTGETGDVMTAFENMVSYPLIDNLSEQANYVAQKYTANNKFDYAAALSPSAEKHRAEFDRVSFELDGDEAYENYDNNALIALQKGMTNRINHEFMERSYEQSRYAQVCVGGSSAPRLCGMWTGEWNPGWRGIYTLDANVNLQVSAMNTGNLREFQLGYITFFLRHAPDFMYNAEKAYGMHDALQVSVNADADRAMHVEYDSSYPFEYWNAGASWCLLPIYEYWQCFGNVQIPINDYMRIDDLQKVLSINDGGLTDKEFNALKAKGYLDLESDILLPLLTKQANFWEQIVTPRYYTDINGKACHDESKTELKAGEKYIIIPAYSPENHPIGYTSTLTANAVMDISAAKDGLDMVCAMEKLIGREGADEAIEKWQTLKNNISDYKTDTDGALREWAMEEYTENNNHRHLSHLYVAWPAYDTQNNPDLAKAANIALNNRNKYNTGDATAGHGWMHKALVEARLKRGDGMMKSLLKMMNGTAYYSSLMTDHDTNRRNDTYCTDTSFGTVGAVNEALAFSNTGEIEIIPALPSDWTGGKVKGLMSRSRAEITSLAWNLENRIAQATITSNKNENIIKLRCGERWTDAQVNGEKAEIFSDDVGKYIVLNLNNGESAEINFILDEVLNAIVVKNGDKEIDDSITINKGDKVTLTAESLKNAHETVEWNTDSMAIISVSDGVITANNSGSTVLTVTVGNMTKKINVKVTGGGEPLTKQKASFAYGTEGYSGNWAPSNAFDGNIHTAYASKDNTSAKYLEAALDEPAAVTQMYVVGRMPEMGENYAERINGAKVYAANSPMKGDISKGILVGNISGVTATTECTPVQTDIDTRGESYKYYMIYFDTVNNGPNISMAVAEFEFYSGFVMGGNKKAELRSENAAPAIDGDINTAATALKGEFVFELDEGLSVNKVVVRKQKYAGGTTNDNYWADWVLAVGCEVQGSVDGTEWETIGVMNTAPDGMDNIDQESFILEKPKQYRYIRYVRTVDRDSNSYGAWKFPSDNGNRLNLAEIEVYAYTPYNITVTQEDSVFKLNGRAGNYDAYLAYYDEDGRLESIKKIPLTLGNSENEIPFEINRAKIKLFIWHNMQPAARVAEIS